MSHSHNHSDGHSHVHEHTHSHGDGDHHHHGPGHNRHDDHMHSHVGFDVDKERRDRLQAMAATFIEGFRKADDKPAFLDLANIAQSRVGADGLKMHLVDTAIVSKWQLGTASPAFASRELVHLPYPASMVQERETMVFTYVSLTQKADIDLLELLQTRAVQSDKE